MGLLNVMVCLPEIIAALTLGIIVKVFFNEHAMDVVELGGVFLIFATFCTLFIHDNRQ